MPLRDLLYIARQLERYVKDETLYSTVLTKIPVPRFVVFYNGTQKQPERQVLKLSDAFEKPVSVPELELKVLMLNINARCNKALMEKCRTLREYSQFVACIREYARVEPIAKAVEHAVSYCIKNGILADFLSAQRTEVIAMSIFEYNEEEEMKKVGDAHYKAGKTNGLAEAILTLLGDLGEIPDTLHSKIALETDEVSLQKWLKAAAKSESIEQFTKIM